MTTAHDIIKRIIPPRKTMPDKKASAHAPFNIALAKYWGKRDTELNLPVTSSLSVSLSKYTYTRIQPAEDRDLFTLNQKTLEPHTPFARRLSCFLDLFRTSHVPFFHVATDNDLPTAAGLASSASGFAALILALDQLFQWDLSPPHLSVLARLGSGSACRSLWEGFVYWDKGHRSDGMDSHGIPLKVNWPELRVGILYIERGEKPVHSRSAMQRTQETSPLYNAWTTCCEQHLETIRQSLTLKNFETLGQATEANALAMHALMLTSTPSLFYWQERTLSLMHKIWALRKDGLSLCATLDAGPNIKLLFENRFLHDVTHHFPEVDIVR